MSKKVVVILTDGFEEIEAVTPIDILRRADLDVMVVGLEKKIVTGSHGIAISCDGLLTDVKVIPDLLLIPGGPGAKVLGQSLKVQTWLKKMVQSKKMIAAICAAPAEVLAKNDILIGKKATCFPGYESDLKSNGATFVADRVVMDGKIITSRGAGTAMEFALFLVSKLVSPKKSKEISQKILAK